MGVSELAGVFKAFRRLWDVVMRGYEEGGGRFGYGHWGEAGRKRSDVLDGPTFWKRRRGAH